MWVPFALLASLLLATQDVQIPAPPRGFSPTQADMVVDAANVLSPQAIERINRVIFDVKTKSGGEIVVVTLPDLAGRDVGDVALRIGREWRVGTNSAVGDRTRNAGIVVLVVPKESSSDGRGYISIQTGQGTEGFITDGAAGDIRREAVPYFQRQDYSSALELVTVRVAQRFEREFGFTLDTGLVAAEPAPQVSRRAVRGVSPAAMLAIFIILLFVFSSMGRRRGGRGGGSGCLNALFIADMMTDRRHSGWGGGGGFGGGSWGGGGGGFGGFGGGGGFSGGGSSGSW